MSYSSFPLFFLKKRTANISLFSLSKKKSQTFFPFYSPSLPKSVCKSKTFSFPFQIFYNLFLSPTASFF